MICEVAEGEEEGEEEGERRRDRHPRILLRIHPSSPIRLFPLDEHMGTLEEN